MNQQTKCNSCGGEIKFNPTSGHLECQKCHKTFAIKSDECDFHAISMTGAVKEIKINTAGVSLRCVACGAQVTGGANNMAYVCEYCGSQLLENFEEGASLEPDAIIPYAFDEEGAKEKFKTNIARKPFVPNVLKRNAQIDSIQSIYIPSFVFKCASSSTYKGKLEKREDEEYHIIPIEGTTSRVDNDIIIECSDYLSQTTLEEIKPFNMNALCKFNIDYVRGYSVEHLNTSLLDVREKVKYIHEENIKEDILNGYDYDRVKSLDIDTNYVSGAYSYTILPTYRISYTYKNKEYNTFMNGQTGKLCGNVPKSGIKIFFSILLSLLAVGGIGYLIYFLIH